MVSKMRPLNIRIATSPDAVLLSELIQRTIRASNTEDYDQRSIDMLCSIFEPEQVAERIENEDIFLCFVNVDLIGTAGLRRDYLRSMFVKPTYQRQGLGKALVADIEERARLKGISEIMVHSSLTARRFYEALGYEFVEFQSYPEGSFVLMKKPLV
ncbi:MAG: GNAT family N-acetyltransferase [Pseudomonadota bacterium]